MTVKFFKVSDDPRLLDKNVSSATVTLNTVRIKGDCSILSPVLETAYSADLITCNYMYIQEWARYYYIDDMTVSAQRIYIKAHVDVLKTYAADIKGCTAIIRRQERTGAGSKTNLYLQDKAFVTKAYNNPTVHLFRQTDGSISSFTKSDMSFVMALAGAGI